jgi:electron transport complex protein RnfB
MTDLIALLDAELPQTQCGLCGHVDGCLPYATAMVAQQEAANLCVPGGQPVADRLAELLGRDSLAVAPSDWPIAADGRPQRMLAVIREDECIGCTKCLVACPVDAIVGSGKVMHSVISSDCTGCELCIPPCPVDCIDLIPNPVVPRAAQQRQQQDQLRTRYQQHLARQQTTAATRPILSAKQSALAAAPTLNLPTQQDPQVMVKMATLRSQINKLQKQLRAYPDDSSRQAQLADLQAQLDVLSE